MTRAYVNISDIKNRLLLLKEQLPPELLPELMSDPELAVLFEFKTNPILSVAARLLRFFAKDVLDLHDIMQNHVGMPAHTGVGIFSVPVIRADKTSTDVLVFPNMPLPDAVVNDIYSLSSVTAEYSGHDVLSLIEKDIAEANPAKYATIHRAVRLFGRRERMPFTRALARYTRPVHKSMLDPERINQLGEHYADAIRGFTITWCESPEDYIKMYERGLNSCMVAGGNAGNRDWGFMLTELNINPTSFFFYHPNTKGAYVHRDGKVIARCITYEGTLSCGTPIKGYGRIYSSSKTVESKFIQSLEKCGYTRLNEPAHFSCTFKVPKRRSTMAKGDVFPLPYFDNLTGNIFVNEKEDKDNFVVRCNIDNSVGVKLTMNSTSGCLVFNGKRDVCAVCNKFVNFPITAQDGTKFCSDAHAAHLGYQYQIRSDGHMVLAPLTYRSIRVLGSDTYYTNLAAAKAQQCWFVLAEVPLETPIVLHPNLHTTDIVLDDQKDRSYRQILSAQTTAQSRKDIVLLVQKNRKFYEDNNVVELFTRAAVDVGDFVWPKMKDGSSEPRLIKLAYGLNFSGPVAYTRVSSVNLE